MHNDIEISLRDLGGSSFYDVYDEAYDFIVSSLVERENVRAM